ncbi:MAG TPA: SIMPL domain-containing protein [Chloroflexia bacterium]|nr:SIMPL domain-containing protein [Chloroflexia bacterium]
MPQSKWNRSMVGLASLFLITVLMAGAILVSLGPKASPVQAETASPTPTQAVPTTGVATTTAAIPARTAPATAADTAPSPATITTPRLITVNAVGQVQAAPDVAYLNVGSEVQAASAGEALDKAKANGENIRKALVDAGIPDKDIQTSGLNAYPVNPPGKDGLPSTQPASYRAYVSLNITINDLSKGGKALDVATKAGANQVGGLSYGIKDDSALRAQALEQAVKQARPKAEAIARGLNLQAGPVITVTEDPGGYYPPQMGGGKGEGGFAPGNLTVGVRVTITYAIQ